MVFIKAAGDLFKTVITMKRLIIVGVAHKTEHPSFQKTLEWIDKKVKPGMRVGVEERPYYKFGESNSDKFFEKVTDHILKKRAQPIPIDVREEHTHQAEKIITDLAKNFIIGSEEADIQIDYAEKRNALEMQKKIDSSRIDLARFIRALNPRKAETWRKKYEKVLGELEKREEEEIMAFRRQKPRSMNWIHISTLRSKIMLEKSLKHKLDVAIMGVAHAQDIEEFAPHVEKEVVYLMDEKARQNPLSEEDKEIWRKKFARIKPKK